MQARLVPQRIQFLGRLSQSKLCLFVSEHCAFCPWK